ncbi:MAG: hypothetical protein HOE76_00180 [Euryarchaeota archaeon]|jgi:hypothetical protein|nr:hypothetical protein [Euryarchaeota archaeon]MBT4982674.1 hypothetical protein [Euryarchaeota archaeon]MBT5185138.1 hypothetical protein [Euryarchaeota archaeon]
MIEIAGCGLTGISCALELLEKKLPVTIYESRQEIGNPTRSPGIIKTLDSNLIKPTVAKPTKYGWALRREWLEKSLAQKVVDLGGIIRLKTKAPPNSVDCTGGKSSAPGWPVAGTKENLVKWRGGIVIKTDIPSEFILNKMSEDRFCFERGDELVECWIRGELPRPKQGWLEILEGEHPYNVDEIWADESIAEGKKTAQNIIQSRLEVS